MSFSPTSSISFFSTVISFSSFLSITLLYQTPQRILNGLKRFLHPFFGFDLVQHFFHFFEKISSISSPPVCRLLFCSVFFSLRSCSRRPRRISESLLFLPSRAPLTFPLIRRRIPCRFSQERHAPLFFRGRDCRPQARAG